MIYNEIKRKKQIMQKQFAVLLDPEIYATNMELLHQIIRECNRAKVDMLLIGGSLVSVRIDAFIQQIKHLTDIPVILFPGSLLQLSNYADALFLLSVISGRNPDFLIGRHVEAAPYLKKTELEIISTGYILIENNFCTSVEFMSNTKPIPREKTDIAVATALAGEMLGNQLIYIEAGSGAAAPVGVKMINQISENIQIPLIVGGGIQSVNDLLAIVNAGADIVVAGNAFENDVSLIYDFSRAIHR